MMKRYVFYFALLFGVVPNLFAQPATREQFQLQRQLTVQAKQQALARKFAAEKRVSASVAQSWFDVKYYGLNLNIDPTAQAISGSVDIQGESLIADLQQVELDFAGNMTVDAVSGNAISFAHNGDRLVLNLDAPRAAGQTFSATISYHGQPQSGGFGAFVFSQQNSQPLIWTLSEPYGARLWWPCKDTPNDKADKVDMMVTVPAKLTATSNGRLLSRTDNGDGTATFHWQENYPITTYLVSLAITNYATFTEWFKYSPTDSMEVTNYIYPANLERAKSDLSSMVDMLSFFHDIFGPYPFLSEKYGVAQFGWGGGMEHQTLTSQSSFGESLTAHELAHQWWGDMITNAYWPEIWLNEGFASYAEALYFEDKLGKGYYRQYMSWMDRLFEGSIYRTDTTSVGSIFNGIVYDKGAWVLHMLRHVVGDSAFFDILKAYGDDPRFKYGNATTAGFRSVCEAVSGMDLSWFFDQWIFGSGRPIYQYSWQSRQGVEGYDVDLHIDQIQSSQHPVFTMPIDIHLEAATQDTVMSILNNEKSQSFTLNVPFNPTVLFLDEDAWILKQVQFVPTSVENGAGLPQQFILRQNYPNPFNAGTTINFTLQRPDQIALKIYNAAGQLVRQFAAGFYDAGNHHVLWDGKNDHGQALASGVYLYEISNGKLSQSKKLLLMN